MENANGSFVSERLKLILVIKSSNTQMAMSQKSRDHEKWLSFPTKKKRFLDVTSFQETTPHFDISTNSMQPKRKPPKVQKKIRFGTPRLSSAKMVDITGDGTGGCGIPVRDGRKPWSLDWLPLVWQLAHRDWQMVRISNFVREIYLVSRMHQIDCMRNVWLRMQSI